MVKNHIIKIKKLIDIIYNILVVMGFISLICYLPDELANFFGLDFFRGQIMLMFFLIGGFILFKFYIDKLYEDKKINEKYYNTKE